MGGKSCSKLLCWTDQKRRMLVLESEYFRYVAAWMEVNRHIQICDHLPENIIFWLVVV